MSAGVPATPAAQLPTPTAPEWHLIAQLRTDVAARASLVAHRKAKGMRQHQLGEQLGVSGGVIVEVEKGIGNPAPGRVALVLRWARSTGWRPPHEQLAEPAPVEGERHQVNGLDKVLAPFRQMAEQAAPLAVSYQTTPYDRIVQLVESLDGIEDSKARHLALGAAVEAIVNDDNRELA